MTQLKQLRSVAFKEEEFLDKKFSVDQFVSRCKDQVTMSELREDLENHYKNIQMSLIELINQDYADFVSLSSNLVGADRYIEHLNAPLGQLQEEILGIKNDLSYVLSKIDEKLKQRQQIREKKSRLHHLINVVHCVEKIEKILKADPKSPDMEIFLNENRDEPGNFLERVAGEFNQLQFHVNQSKGHPIIESIRPRVSLITSKLQENLESTFEQGILNRKNDLVLRCLRTYALIDKTSYAEDLYRHLIVKPFVEEHITENYLNENDIEKLCNVLIKFVREDCDLAINVTCQESLLKSDSIEKQKNNLVKGFDFLVNSIWIEIAEGFEEKLPLLFSPGDPDLFLKRYRIMMKFIDDLEGCCVSNESFRKLRNHPSYQSFMIKWSLPVYFQIRFQEIGVNVEVAIDSPYGKSPEKLFMTNVVGTIWQSVLLCWSENIYIPQLTGRFWKLNLQLGSRLASFIKTIIKNEVHTSNEENMENLSLLLGDGSYFNVKFKEEFKMSIQKHIKSSGVKDIEPYKDALMEVCEAIVGSLNELEDTIVNFISTGSCLHLENVKNIPRLYRRTNKEPPSQSSSYIESAFKLLNEFQSNSNTLDAIKQKEILNKTVTKMTSSYSASVDELLLSVKKTEDSLLRLKQQRKAASGQTNTSIKKSDEVSDENKIRMQVALDVLQYTEQVITLGLQLSSYQELTKLKDETQQFLQPRTNSLQP